MPAKFKVNMGDQIVGSDSITQLPPAPPALQNEADWDKLKAKVAAIRDQTRQDASAAGKAARTAADPEKARYPVIEDHDQMEEMRAALQKQGLGAKQIERKLNKWMKKGGKIKTSAKLLKIGRILGDTLAGYNPAGYQPGQPTAMLTKGREAKLDATEQRAYDEVMAGGDEQMKLELAEAQLGLEQVAKGMEEEARTKRQQEKAVFDMTLDTRKKARDAGIADYMNPDINVVRAQLTEANLKDRIAEDTDPGKANTKLRIKALDLGYAAALDEDTTMPEVYSFLADAGQEKRDLAIGNATATLLGKTGREDRASGKYQAAGGVDDPVVKRRRLQGRDEARQSIAATLSAVPGALADYAAQGVFPATLYAGLSAEIDGAHAAGYITSEEQVEALAEVRAVVRDYAELLAEVNPKAAQAAKKQGEVQAYRDDPVRVRTRMAQRKVFRKLDSQFGLLTENDEVMRRVIAEGGNFYDFIEEKMKPYRDLPEEFRDKLREKLKRHASKFKRAKNRK